MRNGWVTSGAWVSAGKALARVRITVRPRQRLRRPSAAVLGTVDDDLYGVSVWQTLSPALRVQAAYTAITDESRDVDLRGTWYENVV